MTDTNESTATALVPSTEDDIRRLGGAWIRVVGATGTKSGDESPASEEDAMNIIHAFINSAEFRGRVDALHALIADLPFLPRKENGRALIIWLGDKTAPPDDQDPGPTSEFLSTTVEFATLCAPLEGTRWVKHIEAKYRETKAAEWMQISPYFAEIVRAIERAMGAPGAWVG